MTVGRTTLSDFEEYGWTVGRGYLALGAPNDNGLQTGVYRHPIGVVEVDVGYGMTAIGIIREGISIHRRWPRELAPKVISRLCREFLEEPPHA